MMRFFAAFITSFMLIFPALSSDIESTSADVLGAVSEYYVKETPVADTAVNMVLGLKSLDSGINVIKSNNELLLLQNGLLIGKYIEPQTISGWAKFIDFAAHTFALNSGAVRNMSKEKLPEVMISHALEKLDKYSYYDSKSKNKGQQAKTKIPQIIITSEYYKDDSPYEISDRDGYLTIVIESFKNGTTEHIRNTVEKFQTAFSNSFKGIIIDLRNNQGGTLLEAVNSADLFLDGGKIADIKGRSIISKQEYFADSKQIAHHIPIVIIVNKLTASSAELFAAALRENGRAAIIGEQSYGKASVQARILLSNSDELVITWAGFLTPKGRNLEHTGLAPDIIKSYNHYETAKQLLNR